MITVLKTNGRLKKEQDSSSLLYSTVIKKVGGVWIDIFLLVMVKSGFGGDMPSHSHLLFR